MALTFIFLLLGTWDVGVMVAPPAREQKVVETTLIVGGAPAARVAIARHLSLYYPSNYPPPLPSNLCVRLAKMCTLSSHVTLI